MSDVTEEVERLLRQAARQALHAGRFWFGLGLSILAFYLAVRRVDLGQVRATLVHPSWPWMVLAWVSVLITLALKALRWQATYPGGERRPPMATLTSTLAVGMMANLLIPIRLGELIRAYLLSRLAQRPVGMTLSTIVVEKWSDLVALAIAFFATIPFVRWPDWVQFWGLRVAATGATITGALFVAGWMLARWRGDAILALPWQWSGYLRGAIQSIRAGLAILRSPMQLAVVLGWTAVVWCTSAATNYLVLRGVRLPASWEASWVLLILLQAGSALPSSPGKVGVFHYLAVLGLSLYGIADAPALAYAIWLHLLVVGTLVMLGWICLLAILFRPQPTLHRLET